MPRDSKGNYTVEDNGLSKEWRGNVFMNPPYGRQIINWVKKAKEESDKGATVVCLVPARTEESKTTDDHQVFHNAITLQNTEYFLPKLRSGETVCITMQH